MKIDKYADFKINEGINFSRTADEEQGIVKTALGLKDIWEEDWYISTLPSFIAGNDYVNFDIGIVTNQPIDTSTVIIKRIQYKNNILYIGGQTK